ncbi:MAG TPA: hypothetical protein VGM69_07745 [Chloroflexota bacterium]
MSATMVKRLIAVALAAVLLTGTVGEAFAAKPSHAHAVRPTSTSSWQVSSFGNGTWD